MAELPENDRIAGPFLAANGQTDFPGDFPLIDAPGDEPGSCVVFSRERNGVRAELALGDFTIAAATDSGFTLRLVVPALAGDRCFIIGRQKQNRLRAHPVGGAIRTPTLEGDARELAAKAQEARRDLDQAIMVAPGESPGLPLTAEQRRGRVLGFTNSPGATAVAVPNSAVAIGEDLAAAAEARLGAEDAYNRTLEASETIASDIEAATAAVVLAAGGARDAAVAAKGDAEEAAAEAATYLAAFPAGTIYDTEAAGRAAVADGVHFWVKGATGLQSYRRVNAGASTPGPLQPSLVQVQNAVKAGQHLTRAKHRAGSTGQLINLELDGATAGLMATPTGQRFTFPVQAANPDATLYLNLQELLGGDYREVRLPDGVSRVPGGALVPGTWATVVWLGNVGRWGLETPVVIPKPPASSYVIVTLTDGGTNNWVLTPTTPLPNDTGAGITFRFRPPNKAPGDVLARVIGINNADPWYVVGPGGNPDTDQLQDGTYTSDDELEFERVAGASVYRVKRVLNATLAKVGSAAAGGDPFTAWAGAGAAALAFTGSL